MNPESTPLISVIVAVYNGEETLQQCINSVAQQTYPDKELIIIDGGSTDSTVDLLKKNSEQINYWISEPDQGIYNAWNKGLSQAKGEWICFLGADDYFWDLNVLKRMANSLTKLSKSTRVVYGQVALVTKNNDYLYTLGEPWSNCAARFKQVMSIPHPGTMHHRTLFADLGIFDESFRIAGDYELLLRELKSNPASYISLVIVGMRQGGISSDANSSLLQLREVRSAQCKHGFRWPGLFWMLAVARVYVRIILWKLLGDHKARKVLDWGRGILGRAPYWTRN